MRKAEEIAYEIYPARSTTSVLSSAQVDLLRKGFIKGYEQTEKDLVLTWEKVREIIIIADNLCDEWGTVKMHELGQEAYYTEVLKRFNNTK